MPDKVLEKLKKKLAKRQQVSLKEAVGRMALSPKRAYNREEVVKAVTQYIVSQDVVSPFTQDLVDMTH